MLFFGPKIEVKGQNVFIYNIRVTSFENDLKKLYGTTTMSNYMFRRKRWDTVQTKQFFLVELHFCITKLLQLKNIESNRKDLSRVKELIETETWLEDTFNLTGPRVNFDKLQAKFTFKFFDSQRQFIEQYPIIAHSYHLKGMLLDAKAGSGKTFNALGWAESIDNGPTIITCPLGIVNNVWVNHLHTVFKKTPTYWTSLMDGPIPDDVDYLILHYDYMFGANNELITRRLLEISKKRKMKFKLIVDECHNFNEFKSSERPKRLVKMADEGLFSHALPMSGTPLKALGREAFTVFCLIDPYFMGHARDQFLDAYGRSRDKLNELLNHRIGRSKFTISSLNDLGEASAIEPVLVSFPGAEKYTLNAIRLEMQVYITDRVRFYNNMMPEYIAFFKDTLEDYKAYIEGDKREEANLKQFVMIVDRFRTRGFTTWDPQDVADNKFCKEVEARIEARLKGQRLKDFRSIKSAVKYLNLKLQGEALGNVLGKARMGAIRDTIAYAGLPALINSVEKKTLIFTSYVEVLKELENYLHKNRIGYVSIHGENNNNRDQLIREFDTDPNVQVCIAVYNSLKEGQPMLSANGSIFMNMPFRDYELKQAVARTWRTGQTAPCFFWNVILDTGKEENITSRTVDILEWSKDQVDQLLSKNDGHIALGIVEGTEEMELIAEEPIPYHLYTHDSVLSLFK